jgi:hypothetical protein
MQTIEVKVHSTHGQHGATQQTVSPLASEGVQLSELSRAIVLTYQMLERALSL